MTSKLPWECSSSESSTISGTEEKSQKRSSANIEPSEDGWTTVPKKKSKRKKRVLGVPNIRSGVPAYERNINSDAAGLPDQRIAFVSKILRLNGVKSILELGCGDMSNGIKQLRSVEQFTSITGVDIDSLELKRGVPYALGVSGKPKKVRVFVGDATIPCREWLPPPTHDKPPDAVISLEVVEHLHSKTLSNFPKAIFGVIQPRLTILTTPNADFNVVLRRVFGELSFKNKFRHWDHKFEWNRFEIKEWCQRVVKLYPEYKFKVEDTGIIPGTTRSDIRTYGRCSSVVTFVRDPTKPLRPVKWGETKADIFL